VIVYEVNLFVRRAIEREFRAWLDAHVREILALPGFEGAQLFEAREANASGDELALSIQYRLRDDSALADYLEMHAPRLRADGVARFGEQFRANRRVLAPLSDY
jgi:hypothetical protein